MFGASSHGPNSPDPIDSFETSFESDMAQNGAVWRDSFDSTTGGGVVALEIL